MRFGTLRLILSGMGHVQISRLIPASRQAVFRHITEIRNLPEWLGHAHFRALQVELPQTTPLIREQAEFSVQFLRYGMKTKTVLRVDEFDPAERFTYCQISGFFRSWSHTQTLKEHDSETTLLTDLVDFRLPYGILGALFDDLLVRKDLQQILTQRLMFIEEHFKHLQDSEKN